MERDENSLNYEITEHTSQALEGLTYHVLRGGYYTKVEAFVSGAILISGTTQYYEFFKGKEFAPYLQFIFVALAHFCFLAQAKFA
jgi:hypothetical protein